MQELDAYSTSCNSTAAQPVWSPTEDDHDSEHGLSASHHWPSLFDTQSIQVSPELVSRMPFFMDYYKNTMCPSMVFIDGPHNPYRDHMLHLASSSQSLQHAICALSACNLRIKRKLSLGQDTRELFEKMMAEKNAAAASPGSTVDDHSVSEEYEHRNLAVHLLNQQLNDASKSNHDSVLATILILCHYRMVESGIAKFHTQFAGVKKILSLRKSTYGASPDCAWMEAIFTYFDAISASINDREAQLSSGSHGLMCEAQLLPPGAENLVGCDRELFRTISKLGRLNLLSQHRPVQQIPTSPPRSVPSRSQSPLTSPIGHSYKGSLGGSRQQLGDMAFNKTSNGFAPMLDTDDEMLASSYDDLRSAFWHEWKETRSALQSWEFDSARVQASLPCAASPSQMRDLGKLSQAFRYAALLYIERLANPDAASAAQTFQDLVYQVVYYATSLDAGSAAEKFLLWPLFVAGSECVSDVQQDMIRGKCRDIMARSGYMNNLAALDVLERLWEGGWMERGQEQPGSPHAFVRRGPFSWTRCIGGPGVEVEWIIF